MSKAGRSLSFKSGCYLAIVAIIVLDQMSKWLSDRWLDYGSPVTVFPGFDLLLVYNQGAAFSFLNDAGGWQRWFLLIISAVVSVVLVGWLRKVKDSQRLQTLALSLVLAGAIGNLIDRALMGYVIDFISLYAPGYRFATFNIADAAISIGAVLLLADIFFEGKNNGDRQDSAA